ncbi:DUF1223 domain-containing protein [Aureimonas leprariae]|uniref:DUF1223 domain-containing protein n=1 Tax=Plantimonas leprariae TaxID=2615207 RepID=A0A7V7TXK5_9HYPH|nr:DUF1223 domain-containing protein [Aureimonas leprariae]KAB0681190.1 DUF1223 domain-containing protein [Aureimonas leprariae]
MFRCLAAALAAVLAFAPSAPALAGEREASSRDVAGVVELFTSQGCASCPPAEGVLANLARDPKLVVLAYHVDYWDYIGWRDTYGSRDNTERQRGYADALRTGSVYTPQVVVNGRRDVAGTRESEIRRAVAESPLADKASPAPTVTLTLAGDRLRVSAEGPAPANTGGPAPLLVLVTFEGWSETAIDRGENQGRTLGSTNAVRSWRVLGMWDGRPLAVDLPANMLSEDGAPVGCAALLQKPTASGGPGPILAAATLLPPR